MMLPYTWAVGLGKIPGLFLGLGGILEKRHETSLNVFESCERKLVTNKTTYFNFLSEISTKKF